MAVTLYVDSTATGGAGTSGDPYEDLQDAVDDVATEGGGGNIIYCRGTQVLTSGGTAIINLSGCASGDGTDGFNKIIGCPTSSWTPDGTLFTLSGGSKTNGDDGFDPAALDMWWLENIKITEMGDDGVHPDGACDRWVLKNCHFINNNGKGCASFVKSLFYKCLAENNLQDGFAMGGGSFIFSVSRNNGGHGVSAAKDLLIYGSLIYGNTTDGFYAYGTYGDAVINSVIHDNGSEGINKVYGTNFLTAIGNRITDNNEGIQCSVTTGFIFENYN